MVDKKIILSVLIVVLIGIIAATYQINLGDDVLNPLSSVQTENSPITDTLAAPSAGDSANTANENQQNPSDKQSADASGSQSTGSSNNQATDSANSQGSGSGSNQGSGALINANNPVNTGTGSSGSGSTNDGSSSNNEGSTNGGGPTNGGSPTNGGGSSVITQQDPNDPNVPHILPDTYNTKVITVDQAYQFIIKEPTHAKIDKNSATILDTDDGKWVKFDATDDTTHAKIEVYVPLEPARKQVWYRNDDAD